MTLSAIRRKAVPVEGACALPKKQEPIAGSLAKGPTMVDSGEFPGILPPQCVPTRLSELRNQTGGIRLLSGPEWADASEKLIGLMSRAQRAGYGAVDLLKSARTGAASCGTLSADERSAIQVIETGVNQEMTRLLGPQWGEIQSMTMGRVNGTRTRVWAQLETGLERDLPSNGTGEKSPHIDNDLKFLWTLEGKHSLYYPEGPHGPGRSADAPFLLLGGWHSAPPA